MDVKQSNDFIEKCIDEMSLEDLCGQLLNIQVSRYKDFDTLEKIVKKIRPGGIFVDRNSGKEDIKKQTDIINKCTKVPVIVSADIENGPGCAISGEACLPNPMAWGACDDEDLIRRAGKATAEICRKSGIHWSFAPIVDINYNKDNPVTNVRAVSDNPEQIVKIAGAYAQGMQTDGLMVAGCKHFPGDGIDDRNQHFCTTINPLSKEEWMKTYGYVYKKMFEMGCASVMIGHIGFPANGEEIDPVLGPKPGTLSYNTITKLLKEELGFEGCAVSDAMSMVGTAVMCPPEKLSIEFIKSGGDMLLFPLPEDFDYLVEAVKSGELSIERVKDAVRRILRMKMRARLFEDNEKLVSELKLTEDIKALGDEIAKKSITVIRNTQNLIPLSLKEGARFLVITLQNNYGTRNAFREKIEVLENELKKRGYAVDYMSGAGMDHNKLRDIKDSYDCILINCGIEVFNYIGGTLRLGWDNIMTFWRGVGVDHPCVIFTSFGDPYKLYELPFLRTYVNAYSSDEATFKAFAKVLLGEEKAVGKSPISLKGFFNCEV